MDRPGEMAKVFEISIWILKSIRWDRFFKRSFRSSKSERFRALGVWHMQRVLIRPPAGAHRFKRLQWTLLNGSDGKEITTNNITMWSSDNIKCYLSFLLLIATKTVSRFWSMDSEIISVKWATYKCRFSCCRHRMLIVWVTHIVSYIVTE